MTSNVTTAAITGASDQDDDRCVSQLTGHE